MKKKVFAVALYPIALIFGFVFSRFAERYADVLDGIDFDDDIPEPLTDSNQA